MTAFFNDLNYPSQSFLNDHSFSKNQVLQSENNHCTWTGGFTFREYISPNKQLVETKTISFSRMEITSTMPQTQTRNMNLPDVICSGNFGHDKKNMQYEQQGPAIKEFQISQDERSIPSNSGDIEGSALVSSYFMPKMKEERSNNTLLNNSISFTKLCMNITLDTSTQDKCSKDMRQEPIQKEKRELNLHQERNKIHRISSLQSEQLKENHPNLFHSTLFEPVSFLMKKRNEYTKSSCNSRSVSKDKCVSMINNTDIDIISNQWKKMTIKKRKIGTNDVKLNISIETESRNKSKNQSNKRLWCIKHNKTNAHNSEQSIDFDESFDNNSLNNSPFTKNKNNIRTMFLYKKQEKSLRSTFTTCTESDGVSPSSSSIINKFPSKKKENIVSFESVIERTKSEKMEISKNDKQLKKLNEIMNYKKTRIPKQWANKENCIYN